MKKTALAVAALLLACGTAACDADHKSPAGSRPGAGAGDPLRFDEVDLPGKNTGDCLSAHYLGRYVSAQLVHVASPTTISAFKPQGSRPGLQTTGITYAHYPERVDGQPNADRGGTYYLGKPLPKRSLLDLDHSVARRITGATLNPGDYVLFIHLHASAAGGRVTSWRIERTGADPGTTTWRLTYRLARHCA